MVAAPSPIARGPQWQLDDTTITRLAAELAREMYTIPEVLARFNLDPEVFRERVRPHPTFVRAYREAHSLWNSSTNTQERVKLKAQSMFEDWLQEGDRLFHDTNQPLSSKVELLKTLSKVGGLEHYDRSPAIAPGDRVVVQINLDAGSRSAPTIVIDKVAPAIDLNEVPRELPTYEFVPPAPAVYEPPLPKPPPVLMNPSLPPPPLPKKFVPAKVTPKVKLVPFVSP